MSIHFVRCEAVCAKCERGHPIRADSLLGVRDQMKKDGWDVTTSRDICPSCVYAARTRKVATP